MKLATASYESVINQYSLSTYYAGCCGCWGYTDEYDIKGFCSLGAGILPASRQTDT